MTDDEVSGPMCGLVLDWVDPVAIGVDAETGAVPRLMYWSAVTLSNLAVDPERCRLVVTGDFVESTRARMESDFHRDKFDMKRSVGEVAAKTMAMPDGSVDVLVQAHWFSDSEPSDDAERIIMRTVVHEGQHVAMIQADEVGGDYPDQLWARRNLLVAASQVIDEFRAEAAVAAHLRGPASSWDLVSVMEDARQRLQQIVCVEYQEHLDVSRLSYDVLQYLQTMWKVLAYEVAADLVATRGSGDVQVSTGLFADNELWRLMAEPHWLEFRDLLAQVPSGQERRAREDLEPQVDRLADILSAWLLALGFKFADTTTGSEFRIVSWRLFDDDATFRK